ncbi:MAG TPA: hypothetical protein ENN13_00065 [Candidatus Altiarchaeales archaeon]|nr:hypothetical protein [Candidatus Altiarchaeales archaeon]
MSDKQHDEDEIFSELKKTLSSYPVSVRVLDRLKSEGLIEWQDHENLLCCVKQDVFNTVLEKLKLKVSDSPERDIMKIMKEYLDAKKVLKEQDLEPEEIEEILYVFFQKQ